MKRCIALLASLLLVASPLVAAPLLSPAGIAYMKAEQNRIDRQFATHAAQVAGVPESVVRKGMPQGPRITDTGRRVIQAIEQHTGKTLSAAQRDQIQTADDERKAAISRAREEAERR